jgi:hypothetical protein
MDYPMIARLQLYFLSFSTPAFKTAWCYFFVLLQWRLKIA